MMVNNNLVGGFNHLEKIVSVKDYHIYYGQITFMFQTNNQCIILKVNLLRISEPSGPTLGKKSSFSPIWGRVQRSPTTFRENKTCQVRHVKYDRFSRD